MQNKSEYETLLHLQKNGNFPEHIDLKSFISCINNTTSELPPLQSGNFRSFEKKRILGQTSQTTRSISSNFDMWCSTKK